jgi:hypothetical protein
VTLLAALAAALMPVTGGAGADPRFKSPEDALKQGIGAFVGGYYEIALPALEAAAAANMFLGQYYLARLYADNAGNHTDHAKAYMLYQRLSDEHTDADPDDDSRAPFVAKSLTALAGYIRNGLPEIGLKPNPGRAATLLRHSATFFNDEDAQFELAKMNLYGEPGEINITDAKHWLSTLSQKGHAPGQAILALEQWRGKVLARDPVRALSLIAIALENAPPADRVWIEDIYQNIYCGSGASTRKQATGLVADWRDRYGRKPVVRDRSGLGILSADAVRTCENGEAVVPFDSGRISAPGGVAGKLPPLKEPPSFMTGDTTGSVPGGALRDVSTPAPAGDPQER